LIIKKAKKRIKRSLGENLLEVLEVDSESENILEAPQLSHQKKGKEIGLISVE